MKFRMALKGKMPCLFFKISAYIKWEGSIAGKNVMIAVADWTIKFALNMKILQNIGSELLISGRQK